MHLQKEEQNKGSLEMKKEKTLNIRIYRYILVPGLLLLAAGLSACGREKESNWNEMIKQTMTGEQIQEKGNDSDDTFLPETQEAGRTEAVQQETKNTRTGQAEPEIKIADYIDAFQRISGCAVILEEAGNTYTLYNEEECRTQVSPYSTFKIVSALIGLHNQVVTSAESKMEYSGEKYPLESWNADLGLAEAFENSCVWYFRKIIDQVGQEEVLKQLTALKYGNCDISEWDGSGRNPLPELNGFWLDSSLKISPLEQAEVLRDIVEDKTIFTREEVDVLKSIMLVETKGTEKIYGKTGSGTDGKAWFAGFKEGEGSNIYFAIYLNDSTSDQVSGAKAKEIALSILDEFF